jgi:hypothetical protein
LELEIDHDTGARRLDFRIGKIEGGAVAHRLLLAHDRVAVSRLGRIAAERGFDAGDAGLQHREAVACLLFVAVGLFDPGGGTHAAARQFALAFGLCLQKSQPVFGFLRVGLGLAQAHLELFDGGARRVDLGFGLGERQPVRLGIEPHQQIPSGHDGVVANPHLDHATGNLTGDLGDIRLDERVLGRGVAAPLQPEHQRADDHQRGQADQRQWPQSPPHGATLPDRSMSFLLSGTPQL